MLVSARYDIAAGGAITLTIGAPFVLSLAAGPAAKVGTRVDVRHVFTGSDDSDSPPR